MRSHDVRIVNHTIQVEEIQKFTRNKKNGTKGAQLWNFTPAIADSASMFGVVDQN